MLYTVLLLWHFVGHLLAEYVVTVSLQPWICVLTIAHILFTFHTKYMWAVRRRRLHWWCLWSFYDHIAQSVCGLVWDRKWLEDANTDFPGSDVFVQVDITDSWRDLCCAGFGSKRIVNKVNRWVLHSNHTYLCFCSRLFPTWCQRCTCACDHHADICKPMTLKMSQMRTRLLPHWPNEIELWHHWPVMSSPFFSKCLISKVIRNKCCWLECQLRVSAVVQTSALLLWSYWTNHGPGRSSAG